MKIFYKNTNLNNRPAIMIFINVVAENICYMTYTAKLGHLYVKVCTHLVHIMLEIAIIYVFLHKKCIN